MADQTPCLPASGLKVLSKIGTAGLCLAVLAGCPKRPVAPSQLPSGVRGTFPYEPTEIAVHPLTRYWISPTGEREVEARIEFLDRDGFPTRGNGRLELSLKSSGERHVESWVLALSDYEANRSHFDNVTRTYLIRLSLPNQDVPEDAVLEATLVLPDGERFRDSADVGAAPKPLAEPQETAEEVEDETGEATEGETSEAQ